MPKYKTHVSVNLCLFLPLVSVCLYMLYHPTPHQISLFILSFIYGTLFMGPDLDLIHKIKTFSLRSLFSFPFFGYSKVFKHRGISHQILLGTLTRVLWLFCFVMLIFSLIYSLKEGLFVLFKFLKTHYKEGLYALCGLFLSDTSHILTDLVKK